MSADEQRLADLLKQVVPDPPRQLSYEEITVLNAERTVKSWLIPTLAAASVLIVGGAVGAVAATRSGQPTPGAPAAYQGTSRAGGSATPVPRPTSPGCEATPEPMPTAGGGETVTVPSVVGQARVQADATLERAGLEVVNNEKASRAIPGGTTMLQSPAAGTHVARGSMVTLTISSGAAAATPVPTCLPVGGAGGATPTPWPTATSAPTPLPSAPGGGSAPVPTASTVPTPAATTGVPVATPTAAAASVPNLVGQTSLAAQNTAQLAGFTVVVQDRPAPATKSVPAGVVWGQAPASGAAVPAGATVTLYCQP